MEIFYDWIQKLAFFAVLSTVILQMVPDCGFQKYVRFFTGLIMAVVLISPVLELMDKKVDFEKVYQSGMQKTEGKELEEKQQKIMQNLQEQQEENRKIEVERIEVGKVSR